MRQASKPEHERDDGPQQVRSAALVATCLLAFAPAHAQQPPSDTAAPTIGVELPPAAASGSTEDAVASESATALAKKLQNPLGNLISIPFQNNTNFNVGRNRARRTFLTSNP